MERPDLFLRSLFDAAVASASADYALPPFLPKRPKGRTIVVGAGKAAARMAAVVESHWPGPVEGLVVTRYGHGVPTRSIRIVEAGHPMPDAAGYKAASEMIAMVRGLGADDLVLCLISGGGSALLTMPAPGVTLEEKRTINRALLRSGAAIDEMNTVRKHLSAIKGGRFALAAVPARVVTLAISDVPGDDVSVIASGPTVPDLSSCRDALNVLDRYGIAISQTLRDALLDGRLETPKPGDRRFARCETHLIATPGQALAAAAECARAAGVEPVLLGDAIEGEASQVAREQAALALSMHRRCVLLSGGETTVVVKGSGRGGRNAEYLLALAIALKGQAGIYALAGDTDGIDGSEDNAGAWIEPGILARALKLGLDPEAMLVNNDAYGFFSTLGHLIQTGPTLTNVNDFRAILIEPDPVF